MKSFTTSLKQNIFAFCFIAFFLVILIFISHTKSLNEKNHNIDISSYNETLLDSNSPADYEIDINHIINEKYSLKNIHEENTQSIDSIAENTNSNSSSIFSKTNQNITTENVNTNENTNSKNQIDNSEKLNTNTSTDETTQNIEENDNHKIDILGYITDNNSNIKIDEINLTEKDKIILKASYSSDIRNIRISWNIEDNSIVEIIKEENNLVYIEAKSPGSTNIILTISNEENAVSLNCKINVSEFVAKVIFNLKSTKQITNTNDLVRVVDSDNISLIQSTDEFTWDLPTGNYYYYFNGKEIGYSEQIQKFKVNDVEKVQAIDIDIENSQKAIDAIIQPITSYNLELLPNDAKIYSHKQSSNLVFRNTSLNGWVDTREYPWWKVIFSHTGEYEVFAELGVQGDGGTFDLYTDDNKQISNFQVPKTKGGWNSSEEILLGNIYIDEVGEYIIKLVRNYLPNPTYDFHSAPNVYKIKILKK